MTFEIRKRSHVAGALASLFAVTAAVLVLILPGGRESIDYLIAGTLATAVSLAALFAWCVRPVFFRRGDAETLSEPKA